MWPAASWRLMLAPRRPMTTPSSTSQSILVLTDGSMRMSAYGAVMVVIAFVKMVGGATSTLVARAVSSACF
jgi:hypothetical protein